jgi:MoxR-like ATPase
MKFPFYTGDGNGKRHDAPTELPVSRRALLMKPEKYIADPGLADACNVALLLGKPLLLSGEPGTGKTQFAFSLAWELGFDEPLVFETKSSSKARDLFYSYDTLKRFQDAQSGVSRSTLAYITYNALGIAVLRSRNPSEVEEILPSHIVHKRKSRSVVLIDEVDKAPRDFPNDILNELEQMYFRMPELGGIKVDADPALLPILVITSNSEKDLPDAFLRRCIYYNIPFPENERLSEIVANQIGLYSVGSSAFLRDALDIFLSLRTPHVGLRKKPATAELLDWMLTLRKLSQGQENPFANKPEIALKTIGCLTKNAVDQIKASEIVRQWIEMHRQ